MLYPNIRQVLNKYLLTGIIKIVWNFSSDINFILIQRATVSDYSYEKNDPTSSLYISLIN